MRNPFQHMIYVALCTACLAFSGVVHAQTALDARGSIPYPGGSIIPGYDTRTCDGSIAGAIRYNSASSCAEFCNGATWTCPGGLSGPASCASIGDLCADGTVFAGYHPINQEHLFIPPTDQEQPGSPGTFTMNWKNATGTDDISTDSTNDGQVNHANRGGAIANFQAFQACENLGFGGHSDWYLPSQVEAYYLWSVHETVEAGGNITNFLNALYWSSTEWDTGSAYLQVFSNGSQYYTTKSTGSRARCVRR